VGNPYVPFVDSFTTLLREAQDLPLGGFAPARRPPPGAGAPLAMVFSPHPDDESIIGALPLRLLREAGWRVAVTAVTQGSNVARKAERLEEMRGACGFLGMELIPLQESGLVDITPAGRGAKPEAWAASVAVVAELLHARRPEVVFIPHARDGNFTHQGTHLLVLDALDFPCTVVETEFWSPLENPNLMIETTVQDVADLVAAISFHRGEVARNPYHVLLPAWMADNVRRGGERVGGQGAQAPDFTYATLYRISHWNGSSLSPAMDGGRMLSATESPACLF